MRDNADTHGREGSLANEAGSRSTGIEIPVTAEEDAIWREREQARIEAARAAKEDS